MRACQSALIIAMAALWVGAGSHCRLEVLPGFEFLSCCQHSNTEKTPAHHENECGGDACAALESGFYQLSQPQQAPSKPLFALVVWAVPLGADDHTGQPELKLGGSPAPPGLPRIWHFLQRAAPPPRAPSFNS